MKGFYKAVLLLLWIELIFVVCDVKREKRQIYYGDIQDKPKTSRSRAEEKDKAGSSVETNVFSPVSKIPGDPSHGQPISDPYLSVNDQPIHELPHRPYDDEKIPDNVYSQRPGPLHDNNLGSRPVYEPPSKPKRPVRIKRPRGDKNEVVSPYLAPDAPYSVKYPKGELPRPKPSYSSHQKPPKQTRPSYVTRTKSTAEQHKPRPVFEEHYAPKPAKNSYNANQDPKRPHQGPDHFSPASYQPQHPRPHPIKQPHDDQYISKPSIQVGKPVHQSISNKYHKPIHQPNDHKPYKRPQTVHDDQKYSKPPTRVHSSNYGHLDRPSVNYGGLHKPIPAYEEPYIPNNSHHTPKHSYKDSKKKNKSNIPGIPGEDYPVFNEIPPTSFSCKEVPHRPGMYANPEAGCQVYHVCHDDRHGYQGASFLCTNGTIFNQETFSCDWWYKVDCSKAKALYSLNSDPKHNPYYQKPYEDPRYKTDSRTNENQPRATYSSVSSAHESQQPKVHIRRSRPEKVKSLTHLPPRPFLQSNIKTPDAHESVDLTGGRYPPLREAKPSFRKTVSSTQVISKPRNDNFFLGKSNSNPQTKSSVRVHNPLLGKSVLNTQEETSIRTSNPLTRKSVANPQANPSIRKSDPITRKYVVDPLSELSTNSYTNPLLGKSVFSPEARSSPSIKSHPLQETSGPEVKSSFQTSSLPAKQQKRRITRPNGVTETEETSRNVKIETSPPNDPERKTMQFEEQFKTSKTIVQNFEDTSKSFEADGSKYSVPSKAKSTIAKTQTHVLKRKRPQGNIDKSPILSSQSKSLKNSSKQTQTAPEIIVEEVPPDAVVDFEWGQRST